MAVAGQGSALLTLGFCLALQGKYRAGTWLARCRAACSPGVMPGSLLEGWASSKCLPCCSPSRLEAGTGTTSPVVTETSHFQVITRLEVNIFYTTWERCCKMHSWRRIRRRHAVKSCNLTVVTPDMLCCIPPALLVKRSSRLEELVGPFRLHAALRPLIKSACHRGSFWSVSLSLSGGLETPSRNKSPVPKGS